MSTSIPWKWIVIYWLRGVCNHLTDDWKIEKKAGENNFNYKFRDIIENKAGENNFNYKFHVCSVSCCSFSFSCSFGALLFFEKSYVVWQLAVDRVWANKIRQSKTTMSTILSCLEVISQSLSESFDNKHIGRFRIVSLASETREQLW